MRQLSIPSPRGARRRTHPLATSLRRGALLGAALPLVLLASGCDKKATSPDEAPPTAAPASPDPRPPGARARPRRAVARARATDDALEVRTARPDRLARRAASADGPDGADGADAKGKRLGGQGAGLSDPEVIRRAVDAEAPPTLGAKGFASGAPPTPAKACQRFVDKLVSCKLMAPHAAGAQARMCARAASRKPAFKKKLGVLPRLPCGTLSRITRPPVERGVAKKAGQGVGVVTRAMIRKLGKDMVIQAVTEHGRDAGKTRLVQSLCDRLYRAGQRLGRADVKPVCVAVEAPSFNATALGGHILFHTTAIDSLANLAIAQIAFAKDLKKYLTYQITLAAHVLARRPVAQWPVPGCPTGDGACRERKLAEKKVRARFTGLLVAILGHELGHLLHHHARRKLVRAEVLRVNAAHFSKLSKGKKAAFMNKLGSMALSQADEYESDEASLRFLQAVWKRTTKEYEASTGDPLMGPQPMDIVYVALFMQAMSDAVAKLTNKKQVPALLRSHPASHARADRALRVIVANRYAGHELARNAYQMLVLQ
jgi:hypothetical protein